MTSGIYNKLIVVKLNEINSSYSWPYNRMLYYKLRETVLNVRVQFPGQSNVFT